MRITSKHTSKKLIITLIVIIALLAGGTVYAALAKIGPFKRDDASTETYNKPATDEQKKAGNDTKNSTADSRSGITDGNPRPVPSEAGSKPTVTVDFTSTNQNAGVLQVRTLIQSIDNGGECRLTVTDQGGGSYTASAGTQATARVSTCKGFDIPLDKLAKGKWTVTVYYEGTESQGTASKEVNVQ